MNTPQIQDVIAALENSQAGIGADIAEKKFKVRGQVEAYIEENGVQRLAHYKPNLVVILGAKALAHLLAQADSAFSIGQFKFGTKGHDLTTGNVLTPVAPTEADTGLLDTTSAVFTKSFNTTVSPFDYSYQPPSIETQVQYTLTMDKSEGNNSSDGSVGVAYTEAGLFSNNGNLFARETFPALVKTNQRKLILRWTLVFA